MSTPPDVERKVNQLDNDVMSIYELLSGIQSVQTRQGNRLDEIDGRLNSIQGLQLQQGSRLNQIEGRLDQMNGRLDQMDGRLDTLTDSVGEILTLLKGR